MKTLKVVLTFTFLALMLNITTNAQTGYKIKVKIKNLKNDTIYLGHHYGDKLLVNDTLLLDATGSGTFKGTKTLEGGLYFIFLPSRTYFDILIDKDQEFSIENDTTDYAKNLKITGCLDNELFAKFQIQMMAFQDKAKQLRDKLSKVKDNKDSSKIYQDQLSNLEKEVNAYRKKMVEDNKGTWFSTFIRATLDIDVPEPEIAENVSNRDSVIRELKYNYYKNHYFDYLDLTDERFVNTPLLKQKVMYYLEKVIIPVPDTIMKETDMIFKKSLAGTNKKVFQYLIATLIYYYESSKYMGMDAVFVHMADNYYLKGICDWADSTYLRKLGERVRDLKPTLIGKTAYEMNFPDTTLSKRHSLHQLKSKYTIVFFYDPDCGHCKKTATALANEYETLKKLGVELYNVCHVPNLEEWKKFLIEKNMPGINVSDIFRESYYRSYYDIYATPVIYVLNEKKQIIAKRLEVSQIADFIRNYEKRPQ